MSRHRDLPIRAARSKRNTSYEVLTVPVHAEEAAIHTRQRERGRVRISNKHEKDVVVVMAQAVRMASSEGRIRGP